MKFIASVILLLLLNGCSVSKSMGGQMPPDFSKIHIGSTQKSVNDILGKPKKIAAMQNGKKLHIYEYEMGRAPNAKETLVNAVLSIGSAALWELMPTRKKYIGELYLTYNDQYEIDSINRFVR